jgi:hypothetical protein
MIWGKMFMAGFDGVEPVEESSLPKVIDALLIADATTDEFTSRFELRHDRR